MIKIDPIAIKKLIHDDKQSSLVHLLNAWAIEDKALIGTDLQFSYLYELTPSDLLYKSDSDLDSFFQEGRNLIHSLPENTVLQFMVRVRKGDNDTIDRYLQTVNSKDETAQYIVSSKANHLKTLPIKTTKYFMFLTTVPTDTDLVILT